MFTKVYVSAMHGLRLKLLANAPPDSPPPPPWLADADMDTGKLAQPWISSLSAFWPGLQALAGQSNLLTSSCVWTFRPAFVLLVETAVRGLVCVVTFALSPFVITFPSPYLLLLPIAPVDVPALFPSVRLLMLIARLLHTAELVKCKPSCSFPAWIRAALLQNMSCMQAVASMQGRWKMPKSF